jgi:hypothetical protein
LDDREEGTILQETHGREKDEGTTLGVAGWRMKCDITMQGMTKGRMKGEGATLGVANEGIWIGDYDVPTPGMLAGEVPHSG